MLVRCMHTGPRQWTASLPRAFSSAGVTCFLHFQTYEKISFGRFLIICFLLLRETRDESEPQPKPGEFMWRSCSVFYTIHQGKCLLRDPCNQKGGFHVENILLDILFTYLMFFILLYFILLCLINGLFCFPCCFANLTFSMFFPSSHALTVGKSHKAQFLVLCWFLLLLASPSVLKVLQYDIMHAFLPSNPRFKKHSVRRYAVVTSSSQFVLHPP